MATYLQSIPGIYKITNKVNNKSYIGCAKNVRTRVNGHLYNLRKGNHSNTYLQKAWLKYGEESFKFEIIESCITDELYYKEDYWVNKLNTLDREIGYNLKLTDPKGFSLHSAETKKKLSEINKGKKPSTECFEKLKIYNQSDLCKDNLKKAREKLVKVDFKEVNAHKRKTVKNLITGELYESLQVASEKLNIPKYNLSRKLLGKRKNNTNLIYVE